MWIIYLYSLASEILRVVNEEIYSRPQIYKQGVRDLTKIITLPANNFHCIDDKVLLSTVVYYALLHSCVFASVLTSLP